MLPINHDYRQRYKILDKNIEDKNIYDIIKFILVLNLPIVAIFLIIISIIEIYGHGCK